MKMITIFLIIFLSTALNAQTQKTIHFFLQSEVSADTIIIMPDSARNPLASREDNFSAWYCKKPVLTPNLNTKKAKYDGLYRTTETEIKAVEFNKNTGRNEIVTQKIERSKRVSIIPELTIIIMIYLITTMMVQKIMLMKKTKWADHYVSLIFAIFCLAIISGFMGVILFFVWQALAILFFSLTVSMFLFNHSAYTEKFVWRNIYIWLSLIISGFVFYFLHGNIYMFIASAIGLALGYLAIYLLKFFKLIKKIIQKNDIQFLLINLPK